MPPTLAEPARRPLGARVLLVVAAATTVLGALVLVLTAVGVGHADVRGQRLEGALRAAFLVGLAVAVAGAGAAAVGLYRRRGWAVGLLAAVWPTFALVCLALDRAAPAPGPGRPLAFYLVAIGLLPAALTVLLGRGARAQRGAPADAAA
jgi:hypothetical protein